MSTQIKYQRSIDTGLSAKGDCGIHYHRNASDIKFPENWQTVIKT